MSELFASLAPTPLAERLRPRTIGDVVGQDHLLGPDGAARPHAGGAARLSSMILWGPPGCGKTTIARLLAEAVDLHFEPLSAVFSGVADLQQDLRGAPARGATTASAPCCSSTKSTASTARSRTASCPIVEDGTVTLVGATTENPSFELNAALLSRCQVLVLRRLDDAALDTVLERAEQPGQDAAGRRRRARRRCSPWPTATAAT